VESVSGFLGNLSTAIGDLIGGAATAIVNTISGLIDGISKGLADLIGKISDAIAGIGRGIGEFVDFISKGISDFGNWIMGIIWGWIDSALKKAIDVFQWLYNSIAEAVNRTGGMIISGVMGAFDAASTAIGEALQSIFGGLGEAFKTLSGILGSMLDLEFLDQVVDSIKNAESALTSMFSAMWATKSPLEPFEAWRRAQSIVSQVSTVHMVQGAAALIIESVSAGQIDQTVLALLDTPVLASAKDAVREIHRIVNEASIMAPLRYYFNSVYTPTIPDLESAKRMLWRGFMNPDQYRQIAEWMGYAPDIQLAFYHLTEEIPGPGDLIRFVVREVIVYKEFEGWMAKQGFGVFFSKAFWEAHWVLPAPTQIFDAYHRGLISADERDKYIVWHDFKPEPRPDIEKSDLEIIAGLIKTLIPRVDLRRGWELGAISDEDLEERYRWLGYEDDAPLMAAIQKAVAMDAEIGDIRRAWVDDFMSGLITEDQLRANLGAINIVGARQDFYVVAARIRRERRIDLAFVDLYEDGYAKDLITEEDLRDRLSEVLEDPEEIDLKISKAHVRKYQKPLPPRETTEEKAAKEALKYQVAYLIQLFRRYGIERDELVSLLIEAGADPAVASSRAAYEELKRPIPKPKPEEISRAREETKLQTAQVKAAIEEFKRYVFDEDELLDRLVKLGLSEALATATVQLESIRRPPPPIPTEEIERRRLEERLRSLRGRTLIERYRRFSIEKPELIAELIVAGLDPVEASAMADLEETRRPTPKPSPAEVEARRLEARILNLRERILIEQYRTYMIEKDELVKDLTAVGLDPTEAQSLADLEELRRPTPGPTSEELEFRREAARILKLREAELIARFRKGEISSADLLSELIALGYSEDLATAIVALEVARLKTPLGE